MTKKRFLRGLGGSGHGQNGFTLIELMVVVSIISLLVAILLPALSNAREAARSVQCASTHRQFGLAWNSYVTDNRGQSMLVFHGWTDAPTTWWVYLMEPYVGIRWQLGPANPWTKNLFCPTEGPVDAATGGQRFIAMSEMIDRYSLTPTPVARIEQFLNPSNTVLMGDARDHMYYDLWATNSWTYRHGGGRTSNFLLADGHVEQAVTKSEKRVHSGYNLLYAYPPRKFEYRPLSTNRGWPGWADPDAVYATLE